MSSPEGEPVVRLKGENGDFEAVRGRSALYRHLGEHAIYDNVFLITGESEAGREGNPIFLQGFLSDEMIQQVTHFMITRGFEAHLNLPESLQCFQDVHARMMEQQAGFIPDTVPEEWEDGTSED